MKIPGYCPKCKKPMMNEMMAQSGEEYYWRISCDQTDHYIKLITVINSDTEVVDLYIGVGRKRTERKYVSWHFPEKIMLVQSSSNTTTIPFFEPDLTNYNRLIEKLKTYITFS